MSAIFRIKDFQSIKDAEINVDGFTILVGESSQGKSACLRAINATCNNKFKQNFLRYGADMIEVSIDYGEGSTLLVTKNKKESPTYKLDDIVFQKMNRTIPNEVVDFNNFGVIDYFEKEYPLNYFSQFSKPILLEFSQKRILEILSSSKAYDDMNLASTNLNKHKEQNNGAFKQLSSILSDNKNQLSELKKQRDSIQDDIDNMRELYDSLKDCDKKESIILELISLNSEYTNVVKHLDNLLNFGDAYERYNHKVSLFNKLENLEENVSGHIVNKRILEVREKVVDLCNKYLNLNIDKICNLERIVIKNEGLESKTSLLSLLTNRLAKCEEYVCVSKNIDNLKFDKVNSLSSLLNDYSISKKRNDELLKKCSSLTEILNIYRLINEKNELYEKSNTLIDLVNLTKGQQDVMKKKEYMINNHLCPMCGKPI